MGGGCDRGGRRRLHPRVAAVLPRGSREWNPVDPYGLPSLLRAPPGTTALLLIHARQQEGDHDLVGKVNVTNVVRGRALGATLGYDAYDPYAGRGLFAEGLRLVVDVAFTPEPGGMGLHRLEANVQPANVRSAGVLRGIGFRREGFSPSYLLMPTAGGSDEWRDHDRYAVTRGEWPADPWPPAMTPRIAVLVNGIPGSGKTTLARRLAAEAGRAASERTRPRRRWRLPPARPSRRHGAGTVPAGRGATGAVGTSGDRRVGGVGGDRVSPRRRPVRAPAGLARARRGRGPAFSEGVGARCRRLLAVTVRRTGPAQAASPDC